MSAAFAEPPDLPGQQWPDLYAIPEEPERRKAFVVDSDGKAVWAMRLLRENELRKQELAKIADAEEARLEAQIDKITEWRLEVYAPLDRQIAYFEGLLTQYALAQRETTAGRSKSVSTPYGRVSTTATQDKVVVIDVDSFLEWATENAPQLVRTKTTSSPDAAQIKDWLDTTPDGHVVLPETGDIVPGATVRFGGVTAKVDVFTEE